MNQKAQVSSSLYSSSYIDPPRCSQNSSLANRRPSPDAYYGSPYSGAPHPALGADTRIGIVSPYILICDIDVINSLPRDPDKWGGFSRAAIFADTLLVGVIRTVDKSWKGKLEATAAAFLLDDPTFQTYCRNAGLAKPNLLDAGLFDLTIHLDAPGAGTWTA